MIQPLTDWQKEQLAHCEAELSDPVPLASACLDRSFVYKRGRGLFYVPHTHTHALSLMYAWDLGIIASNWQAELERVTGRDFSYQTADDWLAKTEGAAYLSSVSERVFAGKSLNLNAIERRIFAKVGVEYLFEDQCVSTESF